MNKTLGEIFQKPAINLDVNTHKDLPFIETANNDKETIKDYAFEYTIVGLISDAIERINKQYELLKSEERARHHNIRRDLFYIWQHYQNKTQVFKDKHGKPIKKFLLFLKINFPSNYGFIYDEFRLARLEKDLNIKLGTFNIYKGKALFRIQVYATKPAFFINGADGRSLISEVDGTVKDPKAVEYQKEAFLDACEKAKVNSKNSVEIQRHLQHEHLDNSVDKIIKKYNLTKRKRKVDLDKEVERLAKRYESNELKELINKLEVYLSN